MAKMLWCFVAMSMSAAAALGDGLPDVEPQAGWDTLPPPEAAAGDWPWWRGPTLDGIAPDGQTPPATWGAQSNILWQATLPGYGHSSPCVVGDRLYLTAGEKAQGNASVWLLCLERATGKTLWRTDICQGPTGRMHADNAPASATPACDGERVYVPCQVNGEIALAAIDMKGQVVWRKPVAPYDTIQGFSASPSLYRSSVILPVEGPKGCYLTAFHRTTGDIVWRRAIRANNENYAPAITRKVAGREQLLMVGGLSTRSYDPANGSLLWECDGPARTCVASPVVDQTTIYATGGYPGRQLLAIRADGQGDVTKSHLAWSSDAKAGYIPTPLLHDGLLYTVADQGLFRCYDTQDGRVLWEHDLKTPFYSSPVLADGKLYAFDRKGKGFVIPTGRTMGAIVTNELPSGVFATPVILDNRIYLRTLGEFYCIGAR